MQWRRLAGWLLLAAIVGLAVGAATASKPPSGSGRPAPVEDVLRALDRDDAPTLAARLVDAGSPERYSAPWRDELAVAAAASRRDPEALWRIGKGKPGAPAARALLYLHEHGPTADDRAKALDALRADYPASWVVAAKAREAPGRPR